MTEMAQPVKRGTAAFRSLRLLEVLCWILLGTAFAADEVMIVKTLLELWANQIGSVLQL